MSGWIFWTLVVLWMCAVVAASVPHYYAMHRYGNRYAPKGKVYICTGCGKRSRDRYGNEAISHGWDESCMMHAVLVDEQSVAKTEPPAEERSEYNKLKVLDGLNDGCDCCLRFFSPGEVITVADDGKLTFCYTSGDGGCMLDYMVSLKPPRMLMGAPYVYQRHAK